MRFENSPFADANLHRILRSVFGALAAIAGGYLLVSLLATVLFVLSGAKSLTALQGQPKLYTVVNGLSSLGFVVAALGYLALRDEWEILHIRRPTASDAAFVVGGVVLLGVVNVGMSIVISIVLSVLKSVFGITTQVGQNAVITTGQQNPSMFLYMIPVSLLIVGPGEELIFRGVVQGLFRRVVGVVPAIVIASLLFGLGHYASISTGNAWTYIFTAGAMGLVLGVIYEYTENIVITAATHGLWNSFLFAVNWAVLVYDVSIPT